MPFDACRSLTSSLRWLTERCMIIAHLCPYLGSETEMELMMDVYRHDYFAAKACSSPLAHGSSGFTPPRSTQTNGTAIDMSAASSMISNCRHVFCQMNVNCEEILQVFKGHVFFLCHAKVCSIIELLCQSNSQGLGNGGITLPMDPYIKQLDLQAFGSFQISPLRVVGRKPETELWHNCCRRFPGPGAIATSSYAARSRVPSLLRRDSQGCHT